MAAKVAGTWQVLGPVGVADLFTIDTTQAWPLGQRCRAKDVGTTAYGEGEFIYLKGVASVVAKDVCNILGDYSVARIAARAKGAVCLALGAVDAATKFGWFQIKGKGVANCDATILTDAPMYIDGTTARVDDTAVAGDLIAGMVAASADDTNTIVVLMGSNPTVADYDNA